MKASDSPAASLFAGVYEAPEAARYLKAAAHGAVVYPVHSATIIRWIRQGLASPDLTDVPGMELVISFEDLVSMRVIAALRGAGVQWKAIRETERWLRNEHGILRPFASEALWTGQGQVFGDWSRRLLAASMHGQAAFEMLRRYLIPVHGLGFDEASGMAAAWEASPGIVLAPEIQFGAPCLKGTRIPARTVAGMVAAGDSREWVMREFAIGREEVDAACDWESRLRAAEPPVPA